VVLPGCVAAIGNSGYGFRAYPPSTASILRERVDSANRIVELRQRRLDELRVQSQSGAATTSSVTEAEILLEEARLRLLECRAELRATEPKKDD
jgi:outer membrane protein TolC